MPPFMVQELQFDPQELHLFPLIVYPDGQDVSQVPSVCKKYPLLQLLQFN